MAGGTRFISTGETGFRIYAARVPVRTGAPSDAAFIVEMARLASAVDGRPPPPDDPALLRGLPAEPDASVLSVDDEGRRAGAAWWQFREPLPAVGLDGAPVPELVVAMALPRARSPRRPPAAGCSPSGAAPTGRPSTSTSSTRRCASPAGRASSSPGRGGARSAAP